MELKLSILTIIVILDEIFSIALLVLTVNLK